MEGFNVVDAVVAVIIVLSSLLAYSRGLVREAMAITFGAKTKATIAAATHPAMAMASRTRPRE